MAVLSTFIIPGLTKEMYDGMSQQFTPLALQYGMLMHAAGPGEDGWLMAEIWPSYEALDRFFREVVEPGMRQAGASMPELQVVEVHNVVGLPS